MIDIDHARQFLLFLRGQGKIEGLSFGDVLKNGISAGFWWRRHMPELTALLDELEALRAANQWLPIDDKAKNGDWILSWDGFEVKPIKWVNDNSEFSGYTGWAYGTEDWGGTLYSGYNELENEPTDYRPQPAPPQG